MGRDETIYALSSGAPPSGVAVIRVSGPAARFVFETMTGPLPPPRSARLRRLRSADGSVLDEALVLFFEAPASETGEDVVEFQCHGSRAVVAAVFDRIAEVPGTRLAEPGEFARRAFLAGKLDLTAVEALADLVAAETDAQRRQALAGVSGAFRARLDDWRQRLIRARAWIEAELDFPDEEDVPGSIASRAWSEAREVGREIAAVLAEADRGERIREGIDVVVLGPPNAGKSSLVNALARRDVAIVTPEAGTTRDLVEVRLVLGGHVLTVVDTAGLREAEGAIEVEGIRRARRRAEDADLVLWLEPAGSTEAGSEPPVSATPLWKIASRADEVDSGSKQIPTDRLRLSVRTGEGLAELERRLQGFVEGFAGSAVPALVTRRRHREELTAARTMIDLAVGDDARPIELRAEDLRVAADALGRLTGRVGVEDLLDVIFSEFCIGK